MGAAEAKQAILDNRTSLGIEFGSTRIKAVLVDGNNAPIASGGHEWRTAMRMVYGHTVWKISGPVCRLLSADGKGCRGEIWCGADKRWCYWNQCHDARLHAI